MNSATPLAGPAEPGLGRTGTARPLVVTGDEAMLDDILRLTAAAGVAPEVVPDGSAARRCWSTASLVVVGDDVAAEVGATTPPKRDHVLVVNRGAGGTAIWQHALAMGAEQVLTLPADEAVLIDQFADTVDDNRRSTFIAAVVGGCGGAGASTFAAGLAVTAGRMRRRALLIDGDPLGGGLDLTLGTESVPGVRWPDLMGTSGRVSALTFREALPTVEGLAVLSWDRGDDVVLLAPTVMREVLAAGRRGHDVVVVDLPRRLDAAAEEVLTKADTTYLVVPAQVRAVAAATRVAAVVSALTSTVEVVVRGPGPAGLDGPLVSESLGLPLAAETRSERGLHAALDLGEGPWRRPRGPLARSCRAVLEARLAAQEGAA